MKNSVVSTRITSLLGSQPSSLVFACKIASLGPELQFSKGARPRLWLFAFKTATLAPELQVSMGPSPHLWFLHAKERLLDQNYKSPWVPDLTCRLVHANNVISIRITSLYWLQTLSVVFACKTAPFGSELQVSMGPSPHLCFLHSKQRI